MKTAWLAGLSPAALAASLLGGAVAARADEPPPSPATAGPAQIAQADEPGRAAPAAEGAGGRTEGRGAGEGAAARTVRMELPPPSPTILNLPGQRLDLNTALRLAGVQNPELLLARQLVVEAEALRTLAAVQILPSINAGGNYDAHTGVLQQSNGNILTVNRSAVYVGAGSNAVAAGTVNIPGVVLQGNIAEGVFAFLTSRQVVQQRAFANLAARNQVFLRVTLAYSELIRADGRLAVALQNRDEARQIAQFTADYAATGEGRRADADRAATELAKREAAVQQAEGQILTASAELAALLNLDPSVRLLPTDASVVPMPIVPCAQPLPELIAIGLLRRPELGERRAAIREALLSLEGARVLPFSPTVIVGFSAGGFGGGSNLVRPVFGGFGTRSDFDAVAYWTIRNMGVGNVALINLADARLQANRYREIGVLNRVREDVATAYARTHARFAQIGTNEQAVRAGHDAYQEDFERIKLRAERSVLPIELLDSFRLLANARLSYLDAIVDYNRAQFEMYVALGQPPAAALAHVVPDSGIAPTTTQVQVTNPAPVQATVPPAAAPAGPSPFAAPPGAPAPAPDARNNPNPDAAGAGRPAAAGGPGR